MPPIMQVLDVLLAHRLQRFISESLPPEPRLCVGAIPGTQVLDIAHSLQMLVERFLDSRSEGGVAQGDVACYYDSLGVLRIFRAPVAAGLDIGLGLAVVLMQLVTPIALSVVGLPACGPQQLQRRTWGSLTGVRVAGALGRWPTRTTAREALAERPGAGVRIDGAGTFALAMHVDRLPARRRRCSTSWRSVSRGVGC